MLELNNSIADLATQPVNDLRKDSGSVYSNYWLKIIDDNSEKNFQLKYGDNIIGRAVDCDIQILNTQLSRNHAIIEVCDDELFVKDLGSFNCTYRKSRKLRPHVMYELTLATDLAFAGLIHSSVYFKPFHKSITYKENDVLLDVTGSCNKENIRGINGLFDRLNDSSKKYERVVEFEDTKRNTGPLSPNICSKTEPRMSSTPLVTKNNLRCNEISYQRVEYNEEQEEDSSENLFDDIVEDSQTLDESSNVSVDHISKSNISRDEKSCSKFNDTVLLDSEPLDYKNKFLFKPEKCVTLVPDTEPMEERCENFKIDNNIKNISKTVSDGRKLFEENIDLDYRENRDLDWSNRINESASDNMVEDEQIAVEKCVSLKEKERNEEQRELTNVQKEEPVKNTESRLSYDSNELEDERKVIASCLILEEKDFKEEIKNDEKEKNEEQGELTNVQKEEPVKNTEIIMEESKLSCDSNALDERKFIESCLILEEKDFKERNEEERESVIGTDVEKEALVKKTESINIIYDTEVGEERQLGYINKNNCSDVSDMMISTQVIGTENCKVSNNINEEDELYSEATQKIIPSSNDNLNGEDVEYCTQVIGPKFDGRDIVNSDTDCCTQIVTSCDKLATSTVDSNKPIVQDVTVIVENIMMPKNNEEEVNKTCVEKSQLSDRKSQRNKGPVVLVEEDEEDEEEENIFEELGKRSKNTKKAAKNTAGRSKKGKKTSKLSGRSRKTKPKKQSVDEQFDDGTIEMLSSFSQVKRVSQITMIKSDDSRTNVENGSFEGGKSSQRRSSQRLKEKYDKVTRKRKGSNVESVERTKSKRINRGSNNDSFVEATNYTDPKEKVFLFTGIAVTKRYKKVIEKLHGRITESMEEATYLVTDRVRRTLKFLGCLSRGIPMVTPDWLDACIRFNCFVSTSSYLVKEDKVNKWGINLEASIREAQRYQRISGGIMGHFKLILFFTESVKPSIEEMRPIIIGCSGGVCITVNDSSFIDYLQDQEATKIAVMEADDLLNSSLNNVIQKLNDYNVSMVTIEFVMTLLMYQTWPDINDYLITSLK